MKLLGTFDAPVPGPDVIDPVVDRALEEDRAREDRSTLPLPGRDRPGRAIVVAREGGVLAGVPVFVRVFHRLAGAHDQVFAEGSSDGSSFRAGDEVVAVRAPAGVLLSGERLALNLLQRLCGIATLTRHAVEAAGGRIAVSDTRKTTPGLRALEKYAVVVGGGRSHRWSLADMVMLKENHLALAGGVTAAVTAVRGDAASGTLPLTVEVRTLEQAVEAAGLGVDRVLLDNMNDEQIAEVVRALGARPDGPELEASGGIGADRIPRLAAAGVDLVSLGSLTGAARPIDLSMLLVEPA